MVQHIRGAFIDNLKDVTWMDSETKKAAKEKVTMGTRACEKNGGKRKDNNGNVRVRKKAPKEKMRLKLCVAFQTFFKSSAKIWRQSQSINSPQINRTLNCRSKVYRVIACVVAVLSYRGAWIAFADTTEIHNFGATRACKRGAVS